VVEVLNMVYDGIRPVSNCGRMDDRTNKGGAVLWFLRKHAPMPAQDDGRTFRDISILARSRPRASSCQTGSESKQLTARSDAVATTTGGPSAHSASSSMGPQRRFLHQTVLAIGSEVDERRLANMDFDRPSGIRAPVEAICQRDKLRRGYAAHCDLERERLEKMVKEREAEVQALTNKAEQMERWVAATRHASKRRSTRMRSQSTSNPLGSSALAASGDGSRKASVLSSAASGNAGAASTAVAEQGPQGLGTKGAHSVMEEWQGTINQQSELIESLRLQVENEVQILDKRMIHRKSVEAALFAGQAEILNLRARTRQSETRVITLANELRKVYKNMPDVIQQRLTDMFKDSKEARTKFEVEELERQYREQHFKFMDKEALQRECKEYDRHIAGMDHIAEECVQMLERCSDSADTMLSQIAYAQGARAALQIAWVRLAGNPPSEEKQEQERLRSSTSSVGENAAPWSLATQADQALQQAALTAVSIEELLHSLGHLADGDGGTMGGAAAPRATVA